MNQVRPAAMSGSLVRKSAVVREYSADSRSVHQKGWEKICQ
jgi:hypothetical protein